MIDAVDVAEECVCPMCAEPITPGKRHVRNIVTRGLCVEIVDHGDQLFAALHDVRAASVQP